jgi:hypothetical protein
MAGSISGVPETATLTTLSSGGSPAADALSVKNPQSSITAKEKETQKRNNNLLTIPITFTFPLSFDSVIIILFETITAKGNIIPILPSESVLGE